MGAGGTHQSSRNKKKNGGNKSSEPVGDKWPITKGGAKKSGGSLYRGRCGKEGGFLDGGNCADSDKHGFHTPGSLLEGEMAAESMPKGESIFRLPKRKKNEDRLKSSRKEGNC